MRQSLGVRLLDNDWAGPALVSLLAIAVISFLQPAFLSSFNILVLLSAIAVNMVIALGQLVIIGVGQMNLALGALGGLVAICFVGAIEVFGQHRVEEAYGSRHMRPPYLVHGIRVEHDQIARQRRN